MGWLKSVGLLSFTFGALGCTVPTPEYQAIAWGLNVNQTNRTWIMDNLRLAP